MKQMFAFQNAQRQAFLVSPKLAPEQSAAMTRGSDSEKAPRARRRGGGPARLDSLLDSAQHEAARRSGACLTHSEWERLVGMRIAKRTRVGAIRHGTLTIYAGSASWANELTFLSEDILSRLNRTGLGVKKLRFRVKDLGAPLAGGRAKPQREPPRAQLPKELLERLERVDDPELRHAIAEAASLSLGAAQAKKNGA